jgi:Rho-binding antiterminator
MASNAIAVSFEDVIVMNPDRVYHPIDCSLHDRLEAAATLRKIVAISYRNSQGELVEIEDRILDIFTRDGAEYLRLNGASEIRLDDLRSVDGVVFEPGLDC